MKKTLLLASALILAGLISTAPPAAAQNWYGHTMMTLYWDDSGTTLVGTMVNSTCVGNVYGYQEGQVTSHITRVARPCNGGAPTFVQVAPVDLDQCLVRYYLINWDDGIFTYEGILHLNCP